MTDRPIFLVLEARGQAPEWLRILPLGQVELRDGRRGFEVTPADLEAIIQKFRADGVDLVIDYEHQSLGPGPAPAAGWIKDLKVQADGLYAKLEWTPRGRQFIESHEYRYYSPVIELLKETRRPISLKSLGLVNDPAIKNLASLLAAKYGGNEEPEILVLAAGGDARAAQQARSKQYGIHIRPDGHVTKPGEWASVPDGQFGDPVNYDYPMPDHDQCQAAWGYWNQAENQKPYSPAERAIIDKRIRARAKEVGMQISSKEAKAMKTALVDLLALKAKTPGEEIPDDQVLAALKSQLALAGALPEIAQVLALKAEATPGEIVGAIKGLMDGQTSLAAMKTELTALKATVTEQQAQEAVAKGIKAGKILSEEAPHMLEDARRDVAAFKARMEKRPVIGPPIEELPRQADPVKGAALDDPALKMCEQLGVAVESFKATRDQMIGAQ